MSIAAAITGIALILVVLWDGFETVVLPRRVTRRIRLARFFYRYTWRAWSAVANLLARGRRQENYLSWYGPLSLLMLLSLWAGALILGFALLYWAPADAVRTPEGPAGFLTCLYLSGTTFFTLGLGDVAPRLPLARVLVVLESGMGFGFLAVVIAYFPVMNQAFSRREASISLLDARAGSPPTAAEVLLRHAHGIRLDALTQLLHEWERWSAELLESHLSYPFLAYFRSQHDNQSWLAALTAIMDTAAFSIVNVTGACEHQARLTFAMARHTIVDLALVLHCAPREPEGDRLTDAELAALRALLDRNGMALREENGRLSEELRNLRRMYEPYVVSLSYRLCMPFPPWVSDITKADNWQVSAWGQSGGLGQTEERHKRTRGHF